MHIRRSLDQFGYPSLHNTDVRDGDQVLYKYMDRSQKKPPPQARRRLNPGNHPQQETPAIRAVLMIDTLWLWILANDTILSFAPRREERGETKGYSIHTDPVNAVLTSLDVEESEAVNDCFDLAALIVLRAVEAVLRDSAESSLKVFRVFEGYASDLLEEQTEAFKAFRKHLNDRQADVFDAFRAKQSEDPSRDGTRTNLNKDLYNFLELRDISDELETIKQLLDQQSKLVGNMLRQYKRIIQTHHQGLLGKEFLSAAKDRLEAYKDQVDKLAKSSKDAQDSYEKLLTLKEAHSGVQEARVASEQARVVNIFTIITIIFSPLSFFAGIFGMVGHSPVIYYPQSFAHLKFLHPHTFLARPN